MNCSAWKLTRGCAVAVLTIACAGLALAQRPDGPPDPKQMAERQLTAMTERLKLSDDQVAKIKPILADSMKTNMALREKFGPPQQGERPSEEMMTAMRKNREDTAKKIGEVLTKEQAAEYQKMMSERRGMGGPGGQGGPGGRRRPPEQQ